MRATLARMRVLVSGFEPFGGDVANASADAVRALADGWAHPTVELRTVILPVTFDGAPAALADAIAREEPSRVVSIRSQEEKEETARLIREQVRSRLL